MERTTGDIQRTKKKLLENGMFISRDLLPVVEVISERFSRKGVTIEILGTALKNGIETSKPEEMVGIRIDSNDVAYYDRFWRLVGEMKLNSSSN